jgi:linoleoyl-CoA desaturase
MQQKTIRFNNQNQPEFFAVLRGRVNQYFKENKISTYANSQMVIKTIFMIALYFTPFTLMVTGVVSSPIGVLLMWILMGFGMSGIGLSIMHDANHGAYSRNKKVNKALGYLLNFIGGYPNNWVIQHNVLHHSFTNVDGFDEDIAKDGIMRFSPTQQRKPFFKYQIFYAPFLYSVMTLYWLISKDFEQLVRYKNKNLLKSQGINFKAAMSEVIFNKIWYVGLFLVLPLMTVAQPWWIIVIGFLVMHFICGFTLAMIFQPAHVITETEFFEPNESYTMENSWAIHQLKTTSNFANGSRIFSWLIGGLNYQIEHHLFPNICHIHYKQISKIVKETATEYGIPYYHHTTFYDAVKSHFTLLNDLGTGAYDRKHAMN